MKIKIKDVFDSLILYWMMFYVFILSWLALLQQGALVLSFLIICRLALDFKRLLTFPPLYFGLLMVLIYPALSFTTYYGSTKTLIDNINVIVPTVLVLLYIAFLCRFRVSFVSTYLKKTFLIFNVYMMLNIPVLILQILGNTSLSGRHPESLTNKYAEDLISGLFGYNGTGLLTMYFCFLIILNISLLRKDEIKNRKLFIGYNIFMIAFMLYIASVSDNKALFIILPLELIIYFIGSTISISMNLRKKIKRIFITTTKICLVIVVLSIIINPIIGLSAIIQDTWNKIQMGWLLSNSAHGSAERLGMIAYALNSNSIRWYGAGLGQYGWHEVNAFGFPHFGVSDFGSFICLGGIAYIVIILLFINSIYKRITNEKITVFTLFIGTVIILLYTQLFTSLSAMCSWCFFILTIASDRKVKNAVVFNKSQMKS